MGLLKILFGNSQEVAPSSKSVDDIIAQAEIRRKKSEAERNQRAEEAKAAALVYDISVAQLKKGFKATLLRYGTIRDALAAGYLEPAEEAKLRQEKDAIVQEVMANREIRTYNYFLNDGELYPLKDNMRLDVLQEDADDKVRVLGSRKIRKEIRRVTEHITAIEARLRKGDYVAVGWAKTGKLLGHNEGIHEEEKQVYEYRPHSVEHAASMNKKIAELRAELDRYERVAKSL